MEKKVLNLIKEMPKVELHLHLDGSLDVNYVKEKYKLTDKQINEKMIADEKCHNLNDYLTKFDFPISIMQTKQELENAVYNLLEKLKNQNVIYVESAEDVLTVPVTALKKEGDETYVEVLTPHGIMKCSVTTGVSDGMNVEVTNGVAEGDEVIIAAMSSDEISDMASNARGARRRGF